MLSTATTAGLVTGLQTGINGHVSGGGPVLPSYADATSGKYRPSTTGEWDEVIAAAGLTMNAPTHAWMCQDSSGNLAQSIGGLPLTPNNAGHTYQNTVAGWSTKFVGTVDGTASQYWGSAGSTLPDMASESALLLIYFAVTSQPPATRSITMLGTSSQAELRVLNGAGAAVTFRTQSGSNLATGTADFGTSTVRPLVLKIDNTANVIRGFTDQEKLTPTFNASMTGKTLRIGAAGATPSNGRYNMIALFKGATTEISDANVKSLLQALGWTIPWS